MTATMDDVIARVINLLGTQDHLSSTEVMSLVQTRFEVLFEAITWSARVKDFTLGLVAQTESSATTTVTATHGSSSLSAIGSPFTTAMIGRQIQIGDERQYFHVKDVPSTSSLTLGDTGSTSAAWPNATESALSWRMFKTLYDLPSDSASVISLAHTMPLEALDGGRSTLDRIDPERATTNSTPSHWCYAAQNQYNGSPQIEIWPVPTAAMLLRGSYLFQSFVMVGGSVIKTSIPLLVYASTADAAGLLFSKTGDQSWAALQLFYERKANEIEPDIRMREIEKHSPPRSIGRAVRGGSLSGDYLLSHHTDTLT